MFNLSHEPAVAMLERRAGRTAFGVALVAGAAQLVYAAATRGHADAGAILGVTWLAALGAGLVAYGLARVWARTWPVETLRYASLVVPAIGLALIAPLSVHALVMSALAMPDFDGWARLSLVIAGPAHLAFALLAALRARALVAGRPPMGVGTLYGIVIFVSCFPFIVLMFLPPILVAVTGIPMLPLLRLPERIAARERALEATAPALVYALPAGAR